MRGLLAVVLVSWSSSAAAAECVSGAPANDCDNDTVLDTGATPDLCPFTADLDNSQTAVTYADSLDPLPTGNACTHASAYVESSATLGFGVSLGAGAIVADRAVVGDFAQIGTVGNALVGAHAHIAGASSPDRGTVLESGVIGRAAVVGDPSAAPLERANVTLGQGTIIGRSATIGADVTLDAQVAVGYASAIGRLSTVGTGTVLGNLVDVADDVTLGEQAVLARGVTVGTESDVLDSVIIGPDSGIGPTVTIGALAGDSVRIRKGASIGAGATIEPDVRIGRDSEIGSSALIESGSTFRANVRVGDGATASTNVSAGRSAEICSGATVPANYSVASSDFYPLGSGCVGELVVLDVARGGSGGLDPAIAGGGAYKQWLTDTGPSGLGSNVTAVNELTAATMGGASAVILLMDGQSSNPVLSAAERAAVGQFVEDGGGVVVFYGYQGTDSIGAEFGFSMFQSCAGSGSAVPTAAMPAEIENGPYGTVGTISWSSNCHENMNLGTGNGMVALATAAGGRIEIAMIPPGELAPGSGPVIAFMDYNDSYLSGANPGARAASRNATAYALTH